MKTLGKKGQGEGIIKLLVVAIIAIIAIALAKSYFRESSQVTQRTVEEVFSMEGSTETSTIIPPLSLLIPSLCSPG